MRRRPGATVGKEEPSDRPVSPRLRQAGGPWTRSGSRDSQTGTPIEQYRIAIDAWANRLQVSRNAIFVSAPEYGRSTNWTRERYYGRASVVPSDVDWALSVAMGRPISNEQVHDLTVLRAAVAAYCQVCANMNTDGRSCFDVSCELRPASPLPTRSR